MTSSYRPQIVQGAFVDFIESRLHPFWSLTTPKLRLLARRALSEDLIALQFEVNQAFKPLSKLGLKPTSTWHGGQHINLSIAIDGINHQRSYSLIGLSQQPLWWQNDNANSYDSSHNNRQKNRQIKKPPRQTLTIAIKPQGVVSNYLTKLAPLGTIVDTSMPSGDFTLAQAATSDKQPALKPLLFIAGGSGITPMLGLITQALQERRQVTLLHYNRAPVLNDFWQTLAARYSAFNYHLIDTQNPATYLAGSRHLTASSLLALELPLANIQIFACGAQALISSLYQAADAIELNNDTLLRDNITIESFGIALPTLNTNEDDNQANNIATHHIYLRQRQREFSSNNAMNNPLLMAAEQAGIRLNHGCRQGICHLCRCDKISGVVQNLQTGKVSGDGRESIQTCITIAMSDVVLDV